MKYSANGVRKINKIDFRKERLELIKMKEENTDFLKLQNNRIDKQSL